MLLIAKLYFYTYAYFLWFLSLSTLFIHHFHSYTKIITQISLIPHVPNLIPRISTPIPRIPIIPRLIPRIPIIFLISFPGSPFRLLQIADISYIYLTKLAWTLGGKNFYLFPLVIDLTISVLNLKQFQFHIALFVWLPLLKL